LWHMGARGMLSLGAILTALLLASCEETKVGVLRFPQHFLFPRQWGYVGSVAVGSVANGAIVASVAMGSVANGAILGSVAYGAIMTIRCAALDVRLPNEQKNGFLPLSTASEGGCQARGDVTTPPERCGIRARWGVIVFSRGSRCCTAGLATLPYLGNLALSRQTIKYNYVHDAEIWIYIFCPTSFNLRDNLALITAT